MSIHKSLVPKGRLRRHRNVLSRTERIAKLEEDEKWDEEQDSVFGLPKVRVVRLKKAHAKKKKEEEAEAAEEGAELGEPGEAGEEEA
jgi:small basic protein (TIGR04137 family)